MLVSAAALLVPAVAQATTQTAHSGSVTASFTFHGSINGGGYHNDSLRITRNGAVAYSAAVRSPSCGSQCWPADTQHSSVHVVDMQHNGAKQVVLDLYTGGAHCCFIEQVFFLRGGSYHKAERYFGDPGSRLLDLRHNGHLEFLSANPAFSYLYTSFAASGNPIQIFSFSQGKFHDVTRAYPSRIRADAKGWLDAFKKHYDDSEGLIAAWAADEYMLGRKSQAIAYLNAQAQAGHLNALDTSLNGHKFVLQLEKDLTKLGY